MEVLGLPPYFVLEDSTRKKMFFGTISSLVNYKIYSNANTYILLQACFDGLNIV